MKEVANLLTRKAPTEVTVGGIPFKIDSNFRTAIRYQIAIEEQDEDITEQDKLMYIFRLFYIDYEKVLNLIFSDEEFLDNAVKQLVWFMCGGEDDIYPHRATATTHKKVHKMYDYIADSKYIFAAFLAQYKIDLEEIEYLHWWKFRAMFAGLSDEHEIVKIMGYRACNVSSIKDKDRRNEITRLQRLYALPQEKAPTPEEMQRLAGSIFGPSMAREYEKQQAERGH